MRALDDRREELGITKAELARRADLAPEAVRRLFSTDQPNPTITTLAALADALGVEFVPRRRAIRDGLLQHRTPGLELSAKRQGAPVVPGVRG